MLISLKNISNFFIEKKSGFLADSLIIGSILLSSSKDITSISEEVPLTRASVTIYSVTRIKSYLVMTGVSNDLIFELTFTGKLFSLYL